MEGTVIEEYTVGFDMAAGPQYNYYYAQTFTPKVNFRSSGCRLFISRTGSPGNIIVSLRETDANGHPLGTDLHSIIYNGNTLPSPQDWVEFSYGDGPDLYTGVKYARVVAAPQAAAPKSYLNWGGDKTSPTYEGGNLEVSTTWGEVGTWKSDLGIDLLFEEWGGPTGGLPITVGEAIDGIFALVWTISELFYNWYLQTEEWTFIGAFVSRICYLVYEAFWKLLTPIAQFHDWAVNVAEQIISVLSWDSIKALILSWLPGLETLITWWSDWINNVKSVITTWWQATTTTVQGWITTATEGLASLQVAWSNFWTITWPDWITNFDTLATAWDNFWTKIYPTLVDITWAWEWWKDRLAEVSTLIDSKLKVFLPFRDNLASLWDGIAEFFADPEEWLYKAADRIIERFW